MCNADQCLLGKITVIMMLFSGCIISKWEATQCRLGESERMVGASWESSKKVVAASQGCGQKKELGWEAVCSEEQWSDVFAFWWIVIYGKILEIFSLQKYFPKCLLIAQILSCKITDLAPTYFHDAQCLIFDHLTCFFFLSDAICIEIFCWT